MALLLYAADSAGQALAVALLMIVSDFAPTLLSPFTGTLSDRGDRRRAMVVCELAQGSIIALIAWLKLPLPLFLTLVGLQSTLSQIFQSAIGGAVPELVGDGELEGANAALGAGTHGLDVLGPLLAALLLPRLHVRGLLLVDAGTFIVSGVLLARLPALVGMHTPGGGHSSIFAEATEGLRSIWEHPALRVLAIGFFAVVAFTGVDDVALVFLAKDPLAAGDSGASLLYAGAGVGLLVGFALLSRFNLRLSLLALLITGYALSSSGNMLTGLAWAIPAAFAMQAIRGIGLSMSDLANTTLLQRLVPSRLLGRVFGNVYGAVGIAAGLSYAVGGILLTILSPRVVFVLAGLGGLGATVLISLTLPWALRQTASAPRQTSGEDVSPAVASTTVEDAAD
jgi:MFS family permease